MDFVRLILGLLPASALKNRLLSATSASWAIATSARINPCIFWHIREFTMGDNAYIGTANVFRDVSRLSLGERSEIGQLNWVSGTGQVIDEQDDDRVASLILAKDSAVTARHYLDCSGGVSVGRLTIIAGLRSTILTHSVDIESSQQKVAPVIIGEGCFISACVVITAGTTIEDRCVVAAGSVVVKDLEQGEAMYAGAPAVYVRSLAGAKFFDRPTMRMMPRATVAAKLKVLRQQGSVG